MLYDRIDMLYKFARADVRPGMLDVLPARELRDLQEHFARLTDPAAQRAATWLGSALEKQTATVSDAPWNFDDSDYKDAETYCAACLIDLNAGEGKIKGACKLPVKEPGGKVNRNGVHAAAAVLAGGRGGVDAPAEAKQAAARKLVRLYADLGEVAPPSIKRLAQ